MKPEELQPRQPDAQERALLELVRLAYKINHLSLADVFIDITPTVVKVEVVPYFRHAPLVDSSLSIGSIATDNQFLVARIESVSAQLRKILEKGTAPKGTAA